MPEGERATTIRVGSATQPLRVVRGTYDNARCVIVALNFARRGVSPAVIGSLMRANPRAIRDVIKEARRKGLIPRDADRERGRWVVSTRWHDRDVARWVHTRILFKILDDLAHDQPKPQSDIEQCEAYDRAYDIYLTLIRQIHSGEPQDAPGYISFSRFLGSLRLRAAGLITERKCIACGDTFLDDATSIRTDCYFCVKLNALYCTGCGSSLTEKDKAQDHRHGLCVKCNNG